MQARLGGGPCTTAINSHFEIEATYPPFAVGDTTSLSNGLRFNAVGQGDAPMRQWAAFE
jgi:hypothetical protein